MLTHDAPALKQDPADGAQTVAPAA